MSPLGLRILQLREHHRWSQRELARRAGIRQATISHLESGRVKAINLEVLEKLAQALDVDPGYLIVKKGKRAPKR